LAPNRILFDPPGWDALVETRGLSPLFHGAPPTQTSAWAEVKAAYGYRVLRAAVVSPDSEPLVLGQVLARRLPLLGRDWLYCPYGPVWDPSRPEALGLWLDAVTGHALARRAAVLTVEPRIPDGEGSRNLLTGLGFRRGVQDVQPRGTLLLDLTPDEDALLDGLESRTRYNVGLAGRRGVEIERANSPAGVDRFVNLLEETEERQRFLAHDRAYYHRVWEAFRAHDACDLLLATFDGEDVAGVWLVYAGRTAYYVYGASSHRHSKHKGSQLLQWRAILRAKERGALVYDFWGAPPVPTERHPLWGVYRFKKGFGGGHTVFVGAHDLALSAFGGWAWRVGLPVARRVRNFFVRGRTADVMD
jgi:peptidoglycan pentaglycine glycine transferase (the first glycine)